MKTGLRVGTAMLFLLLCAGTGFAQQHTVTAWHGNKPGAVTISFDDGIYPTQITQALPLINQLGIKATFFVVTNWTTWSWWPPAVAVGHEIGSHTLDHTDLTTLSTSDAQNELAASQAAVNANVAGQKCVTLAYPYGHTSSSVEQLTAQYYLGARGTAPSIASASSDLDNVPAFDVSTYTVPQMESLVDQTVNQGGWLLPTFHSFDPTQYGTWTFAQFTAYMNYLAGRSDIWVAPFGSVIKYIRERAAAAITSSQSSTSITVNLTDTLSNTIFNQALTVRSVVPGWTTVKVQQGTTTTTVTSVTEGGNQVIYYDAIPNGGAITLTPTTSSVQNQTYTVAQGTTLNQSAPGVLANAFDPNGTTLTAQLVLGPTHGSVTLNGDGSFSYIPLSTYVGTDSFTYQATDGTTKTNVATATITITSGGTVLFLDDFTRPPQPAPEQLTWVVPTISGAYSNKGVFTTNGGTLNCATSVTNGFGAAYTNGTIVTDGSIEADISFPYAGSVVGAIVGRLDSGTSRNYTVAVYPEGSPWLPSGYGPAALTLWKSSAWTSVYSGPYGMKTVSIPALGTGWHHVKVSFTGDEVRVFYDGSTTALIDVTDQNSGGVTAYGSGYGGVGFFTGSTTYGPSYNNFVVRDSGGNVVWQDTFGPDTPNLLPPWNSVMGTWNVSNGILQGSGSPSTFAVAYTGTTPLWTKYSVQAQVQFPTGAFGGGISGRVNPATGTRYVAYILPGGNSGNGSPQLSLAKFHDWTSWTGTPMGQATLASVGTGWHTLMMQFNGSQIVVYYDGTAKITVTDNNFDSLAPYTSGGVTTELYTNQAAYTMGVDNVVVNSLP